MGPRGGGAGAGAWSSRVAGPPRHRLCPAPFSAPAAALPNLAPSRGWSPCLSRLVFVGWSSVGCTGRIAPRFRVARPVQPTSSLRLTAVCGRRFAPRFRVARRPNGLPQLVSVSVLVGFLVGGGRGVPPPSNFVLLAKFGRWWGSVSLDKLMVMYK